MSSIEEFDEALAKLKLKFPEIMAEKHKDMPPEMRDCLVALTSVGFQYLPYVMAQGGAAGVSAIRLAFELSKILQ